MYLNYRKGKVPHCPNLLSIQGMKKNFCDTRKPCCHDPTVSEDPPVSQCELCLASTNNDNPGWQTRQSPSDTLQERPNKRISGFFVMWFASCAQLEFGGKVTFPKDSAPGGLPAAGDLFPLCRAGVTSCFGVVRVRCK